MKTNAIPFIAIVCVFSFNCFAQRTASNAPVIAATGNSHPQADDKSDGDLVIDYYHVEETINMTFGSRVTKYEVSKLDMVNTYDLGPNNTRTVTPVYRKAKVKPTEIKMLPKTVTESTNATIKQVKVGVNIPSEAAKYITVDMVSTYANVLDKGYKSEDMLKKVADKYYFEGNMNIAAKYYSELFDMGASLDAGYYYRYARSLRETNQTDKANEVMKLFESKNSTNQLVKK